ncbi:MAG: hypothetical protein KGJ57_19435 [Sphingomonadales bacterium]|nr:hypothetical protein [Sphingomonadales bacterium]MDE2171567.1 hypothetical protein [Sphingomonadales bacterium]
MVLPFAVSAQAADPALETATTSPLAIVSQIELPAYNGDFDHFAYDLSGQKLFLAAEDHDTLEVFKLGSLEHLKTVKGPIGTPHSQLFMGDIHKLLITETGKSLSHYVSTESYAYEGALKLVQGADSMGYDAPRNRAYIVTGGKDVLITESWLEQVNPRTGQFINHARLDSVNAQAMAIEQNGHRLFLNITDKNYISVRDKETLAETARWPVTAAQQNCCFAMDEAHHRLFLVTRAPGKILVLNSANGATLATFDAPARVDQVLWDEKHQRVYVIGGEGWITVLQENTPDSYSDLPKLVTAPGTKTGVLVPERSELYVAVSPGETKAMARVLRISTEN